MVGKDRDELDYASGREKVNQSTAVKTKLLKRSEQDKTILEMIITAGSPSEAWKILLSMAGDDTSEAAQDRVKEEFEGLTFRAEK